MEYFSHTTDEISCTTEKISQNGFFFVSPIEASVGMRWLLEK